MITIGWVLLAVAGEIAALRLIDAGHALHYQHYVPFSRLWTTHPVETCVILLQLVIVLTAAAKNGETFWRWIGERFPGWRSFAIVAVLAVSSTVPSRSVSGYLGELLFATIVQTVNLACLVFLGASISERKLQAWNGRVKRLLGGDERRAGIDRVTVICAVWVVLLSSILNVAAYQRHPHVGDEVAYLYHARYIAAGMLAMPRPEVPEAFDLDLMMLDRDKWYSPVPPGWPVVLAAGVWLGAAWLINPVLAGINIVLASCFLGNLYDRRMARIGIVLLSVSPWNIFMAMSFMNHTATLTAALIAAVALQAAARTRRAAYAFVGGAGIGAVCLIRPLDAAVLGLVLAGWYLFDRRLSLNAVAAAGAGVLLLGGLSFPYNRAMTGNWSKPPIMAYTDKYYGPGTNALGFGPKRGLGWALDPFPGHGPADAAVNAMLNTASVNTELFGWSMGSLVLIASALFSRSLTRADGLMIGVILAVFAAYSLYWFSGGPDFGARYWYLVLIPCVALSVRGIDSARSDRMLPAVACLCFLSVFVFIPWRAVDKYRGYLAMTPDILRLAQTYHFRGSLVLVQGERYPDYESAAIYNPLNLHDPGPIYAWDRNAEARAKVMEAYPDRPVWLVAGPTVTRANYRVVKLLSAGVSHAGRESLLQKTSSGSVRNGLHR